MKFKEKEKSRTIQWDKKKKIVGDASGGISAHKKNSRLIYSANTFGSGRQVTPSSSVPKRHCPSPFGSGLHEIPSGARPN